MSQYAAKNTQWLWIFVPIRESDLRGLHAELMTPYLKSSPYIGSYKIQSNSVVESNKFTGEIKEIFRTADAGVITQMAMEDWDEDCFCLECCSL